MFLVVCVTLRILCVVSAGMSFSQHAIKRNVLILVCLTIMQPPRPSESAAKYLRIHVLKCYAQLGDHELFRLLVAKQQMVSFIAYFIYLYISCCLFVAGTPEDKMRLFLIYYITSAQPPSEVQPVLYFDENISNTFMNEMGIVL